VRLVLDTNVLLDFFMERDMGRHKDCVELVRRVRDGEVQAVVLSVVIAELVWVMTSIYGLKRSEIAEMVQSVVQMKGVTVIEKYEWVSALEQYTRMKVKFIDAMIANLRQIKSKKWTVVTYDKEFEKLNVLRMTPGSVK